MEMSESPATRPAFCAGDPATTAVMVGCTTGLKTHATTKSSSTAVSTFMATPATRTASCLASGAFVKARGSSESCSSPSSRTKPPIGSQFSVYSVSWSWPSVLAFGGKPSPNSSTRMPVSRAITKWPNSWISTRGTRTTSRSGTARTQNSRPSRLIDTPPRNGARRRRSRRADREWVRQAHRVRTARPRRRAGAECR